MTADILIFSIFLALNLGIGLWYGREVKTLRQYAIGDKSFLTGTMTATIVATGLGGGFLFYGLENTYTQGLAYIIPMLCVFIRNWFNARVVMVRMGSFLNTLSIADMGNLYGSTVRLVTAVSGILFMIGVIAVQFKVIPQIVYLVFGLQGKGVAGLAAGLVILYSAFGGIRSVTLTDVLQFIAICICMPTLILAVYSSCEHTNPITTTLTTHPLFHGKQLLAGWNPHSSTS